MAAKKKAKKKKVVKKKMVKKKTAKATFKPSPGTQAKMRKLREALDEIDILEKHVAKVKAKRDELKSELHKIMKANGLKTMGNNKLSLFMEEVDTYSVVNGNWNDVNKYIDKHKAFDLLHRRISVTACRERFGANPPKFLMYKQITKVNHKRK